MTTKNFDRIMAGLSGAIEIAEGRADPTTYRVHVAKCVDVKSIRQRTGLTQAAFALRFGFSLGTLRDWEKGRKQPESSSRVLLLVIDREPEAVLRALTGE